MPRRLRVFCWLREEWTWVHTFQLPRHKQKSKSLFSPPDGEKQSACCIDCAGPSGLFELALTISTTRALTSLLHLRSHTVSVQLQDYQYAVHIPAGLQITLCHAPQLTHTTPLLIYTLLLYLWVIHRSQCSCSNQPGDVQTFPAGCKI